MLCIVSSEGASMVDAGGENFIFWVSRTRENAFLDAFQRSFFFATIFFAQQKNGGSMAHPSPPPVGWALSYASKSREAQCVQTTCSSFNFIMVGFKPIIVIGLHMNELNSIATE